jgi:alpha-beta hydrolase superfamily lysophospholipase
MSQEGTLSTDEGYEIFYRAWRPAKKPKAAVLISHGYAEHSGRYAHVAARLNAAGYSVYANDHRGHGKSPGPRAYVKSKEVLVQDHLDMIAMMREKEGSEIPVFMVGHSLGSTIGVHFAAEYQDELKGLVLSGAGVRYSDIGPSQERQIALASKLAPKRVMTAEWDASRLSHDPEVVKAYQSDPMVFAGTASLGLLRVIVQTIKTVKEKGAKLTLPILVQAGGEDRIVLGARELFDSLASAKDKTLKLYDGFFHEVYNETADRRKVVLEDLVNWLDKHI